MWLTRDPGKGYEPFRYRRLDDGSGLAVMRAGDQETWLWAHAKIMDPNGDYRGGLHAAQGEFAAPEEAIFDAETYERTLGLHWPY